MVEEMSRRERKKVKTRRELVEAASHLISVGGVAELRVADITDKVDVALGTFYSYFETKDDIVEAVVADVLGPLADAVGDYGDRADDPAVAMSVGIRELVRICEQNPELPQLLVRLDDAGGRFERILWARASPIIGRAIASGRFRVGGAPPDLVVKLAIAAVFTMLRTGAEKGVVLDERDAAVLGLQLVGIEHDEAVAIAALDLPDFAAEAIA